MIAGSVSLVYINTRLRPLVVSISFDSIRPSTRHCICEISCSPSVIIYLFIHFQHRTDALLLLQWSAVFASLISHCHSILTCTRPSKYHPIKLGLVDSEALLTD